jgi:hypothetical protein
VFRRAGQEAEAIKVQIAKNEDRSSLKLSFGEWWWYRVFGKVIGYGYRPGHAFWISVGFVIVGFFLFRFGYKAKLMTHTSEKTTGGDWRFNALFYSLETFVPLINLHFAEYWLPDANLGRKFSLPKLRLTTGSLLRVYRWIHIIAGWILTTLWVGALTGLIKT